MTRVRSAWNASTCRSNSILTCASNVSGTPAGCSRSGSSRALCSSAFWMPRSTSRIDSRYASSLLRSAPPTLALRLLAPLGNRVQHARPLAQPRDAGRRIGAAAVAEHPLEQDARVVFHRQRLGRRPPRDGVGVHAAEPGVAGAAELGRVDRQLERRELRVAAQVTSRNLVDATCPPGSRRQSSAARGRPSGRPARRGHARRAARPRAPSRPSCRCRSGRACDRGTARAAGGSASSRRRRPRRSARSARGAAPFPV